jgi:uncharacterized protein (TIGR03083 family)
MAGNPESNPESNEESNEESTAALAVAVDEAAEVIAAVRDDQLDDPTPCSDWDVGQLVAHLVVGAGHLLEQARGGQPDWSAVPDRVDDAAGTFRANGAALLAHLRDTGGNADWQLAELAVHTWDLVTATGQSPDLDPVPAERGHAFMAAALQPEMRGDVFGPEQPAPVGADAHTRLAAFAGRSVG